MEKAQALFGAAGREPGAYGPSDAYATSQGLKDAKEQVSALEQGEKEDGADR